MTVYAPGSTSAGSRPSSALRTARSASAGTSSDASLRSTDSAKPDEFSAIAMTEQPACVDVAYARKPVDPAMNTSFAVVSMKPAASMFAGNSSSARATPSARSAGVVYAVSSSQSFASGYVAGPAMPGKSGFAGVTRAIDLAESSVARTASGSREEPAATPIRFPSTTAITAIDTDSRQVFWWICDDANLVSPPAEWNAKTSVPSTPSP